MSTEHPNNAFNKQITSIEAYEELALAFAAVVDTKPHNAYYERPATLSLLPEVKAKAVLDAGCGPGIYSQWLINQGANVTAVDGSSKMVELAKVRLDNSIAIYQADLSQPLTFLESNSFDIVLSPLVIDCIADWHSLFKEFYRLLKSEGYFIFSIGHPFHEFTYFKSNNYFATEAVQCTWKWDRFNVEVTMPSYRRPLSQLINPLIEAGFTLEKIIEPLPTQELKQADALLYEKLSKQPAFLCIKARKP